MCSYTNVHMTPCSHYHEPVFVNASHIYITPGGGVQMTVTSPTELHQHPATLNRRVLLIGFMSGARRQQKTALRAARTADHSRDNLCDVLNLGERGEDLTNENALPPQAQRPDKALHSQEIR